MTDAPVFDVTPDALVEFRDLMQTPAARAAFTQLKAEHASEGTKRSYEHIMRLVGASPWAIRSEMLAVIVDLLAFRARGGHLGAEEIADRIGAARRPPSPASPQGVAILPLHGVIIPKADMMTDISGGTSIASFRSMFRDAMMASDVGAIVLDIDSPGGMVDQVPEMAAEMRAARGTKPIIAVANTEAASAAYWLASQADEIVMSKSARVGSVGVFAAHEDRSGQQEAEGIRTTLVSAGKFKTEGNPFEPLTDDARAALQNMVDEYYGMFVSDVAKGRGVGINVVRSGFGQGRMVGATEALAEGMVQRVASLDEVVHGLLTKRHAATTAAAMSEGQSYSLTVVPDPEPTPEPTPEPEPIAPEPEPVSTPDPLADIRARVAALRSR